MSQKKDEIFKENADREFTALNYSQWDDTFDEAYEQIRKHKSSKSNADHTHK